MALPSQMERSAEMSRPVMARTGGGLPNKIIVGTMVVLAVAGAAWSIYKFFPSTKPANAEAGTLAGKPSDETTLKPAPRSLIPTNQPTNQPTNSPSNQPPQGGSGSLSLGNVFDNSTSNISGKQPTNTPNSNPGSTPGTRPTPVDVTRPDLQPQSTPGAQTPGTSGIGSGGTGTTPPGPGTPNQPTSLTPTGPSSAVSTLIAAGDTALSNSKLSEARVSFSRALMHPDATRADQESLRSKLATINEDLIFSPKILAGDSFSESYTVQSGDSLVRIAKRREVAVDWRFIQRINRITNPNALRLGQKLKLVRGPFHAIVHKDEFRLDLFTGSPDEPENWLFVKSFKVGLGESNSTPLGSFTIKKNSKVVNPPWTNPRTGEKFGADDPKNPIGEFWLGFEGLGDAAIYKSYGLHGTIDPDSVGLQKSMGCVRMLPDDIALMYEMLVEQVSVVKIVP